MEIRRIAIDTERARGGELVPAVSARQQANTEHPGPSRGEQIPHRVADHIAVPDLDAELLLASQEQIRLGLRAKDIATVDDHHVLWHAKRLE